MFYSCYIKKSEISIRFQLKTFKCFTQPGCTHPFLLEFLSHWTKSCALRVSRYLLQSLENVPSECLFMLESSTGSVNMEFSVSSLEIKEIINLKVNHIAYMSPLPGAALHFPLSPTSPLRSTGRFQLSWSVSHLSHLLLWHHYYPFRSPT